MTDNGSITVSLGFTFSFFNVPYNQVTIASNGYLTFGGSGIETYFQGNYVTGESIWLWWNQFSGSTGQYKYTSQGVAGERVFIVEYLVSALSVQLSPNGPDICSDKLYGQIRLYELDYSIEIEIVSAPVLQNTVSLSGIHSDVAGITILTLEPDTFSYASGSWDGSYFGNSPDPAWLRHLCPFPIIGRFVCKSCVNDLSCVLPDSSSGSSRCSSQQTQLVVIIVIVYKVKNMLKH